MIPGMYSAASALNAAALNQEMIADNLANANMPGYRRQSLVFESVQQNISARQSSSKGDIGGTQAMRSFTSFDQGPIQLTGNPLDLALSGNTFFVLDGPNGPVYTRNGSFELDAQGNLQSHSGLPVRSGGGKISIPPNTTRINVASDGTVTANNVSIGKLQLAEFSDPSVLERAGTTLFQGPAGRTPEPGTFRIEQGYQEGSNVQIVNEMVSMITGMRYYEAAQRALRALGDAVALDTNPQQA
jgi:flagellar basal-body rod protein FlgF